MHLLEHLDLHSFVHGKAHQRAHERNCIGHAQSAKVVLSCIFAPGWDKVLLLESLLLITCKVHFPILKYLFLGKLSPRLRQHGQSIDLVIFEFSKYLNHVLAGDLIFMIGRDCAQVLHHRVNSICFFLFHRLFGSRIRGFFFTFSWDLIFGVIR
jgi:hypothetical protein